MVVEKRPNPGSDAALNLGCTCPVLDNNHGKFGVRGPNDFWITSGCPVHTTDRTSEGADHA